MCLERKLEQDVLRKLKQRRLKRFWSRLVSVMMCVVVFCTTYALILPAITKETDTFCGLEAHEHTSDCFPQQGDLICEFADTEIHTHTEECHPRTEELPSCGLEEAEPHTHTDECISPEGKTLSCHLTETEGHAHTEECLYTEEKTLSCTQAETEGHVHIEECQRSEEKILVCPLAETEGHAHTEACQYTEERILCCTLAETQGHTHTDACTVTETYLICGLEETEEHVHEGGCYTEVTSNVCGMAEAAAHMHIDSCYTVNAGYSCGLQESAAHFHTDECYSITVSYGCGQEEKEAHFHGDACYNINGSYSCGLEEEAAHAHGDDCYTIEYTCGLTETEGHAHSDECYLTLYDCGLHAQVHTHTDDCYDKPAALICTLEENDGHTHGVDCFEGEPACELEEHEHTLACYSDPEADVESAAVWESTFAHVTLTGDPATDVVAIAQTQIGYTESTRNYQVWEDNSIHGYTRYGAWYGVPYGDWCGMFASFCLRYAGVNSIPINYGVRPWISDLAARGLYFRAHETVPTPGCLIFFDWEGDGLADHVGIVEKVSGTDVVTIEGNSGNRVARNSYSLHDGCIDGYGLLTKPQPPAQEDAGHIGPGDTVAWATLVDPTGQLLQQSPFGLRMAGAGFYSTRAGGTLDLKPYIINVIMYDADGNPIQNGSTVTEGDVIEFKIQYTVSGQQLGVMNGESLTVYSDTLSYNLPSNFKIVKNDSGTIINSNGEQVGTYVIDNTDGTITMTFLEEYVTQNANGVQIQGSIAFFSTVTKITDEDNEEQDYEFKDGITLGVTVQEKEEAVGDLTIEKKAARIVGEEIEYEIIVKSGEGTKGPITITDTMSAGLTFKEGISILKNGSTAVDADFDVAADKRSFTLSLPEMAAGESYTVRYKCTADIDLLGADMTARNTASVSGKDSHDQELEDEATVEHVFDMLKKAGKNNGDGTITWTITVNQAKADISGWVLKDIMTTAEGESEYKGTVTIKDSNGNTLAQNVKLPYTFPEDSDDTYSVTYTTSHDFSDGNAVSNKAILTGDGSSVDTETEVGVGTGVRKSGTIGEIIQDANGKNLAPITWTVTVDTSSGPIPAGTVMEDVLWNWTSGDMYMTRDQLLAARTEIDNVLKSVGSSVVAFEAKEHVPGDRSGATYTYPNIPDDKVYESFAVTTGNAISKGQTLVFTYQAYGVFENNTVAFTTYINQFIVGGSYRAEGDVNVTVGTVKATKMALEYYDPVADKDEEWFWNKYHWNGTESTTHLDYEQLHDDYLAWAIELSVPPEYVGSGDIVLYEDLPADVTVKGLVMPFMSGQPAAALKLTSMLPGQVYTYPISLPNQTDPAIIVVKLTESGDLEMTLPGPLLQTMANLAKSHNEKEWYAYLHIFTQIKDDVSWTPSEEGTDIYLHSFQNRFTLVNNDGDVIDVGSQNQVIRKDESSGAIRKEAIADENNIVNYSVILNAYGKDLIENAETLRIHDELTYTSTNDKPVRMRLVPGSVKLYEIRLASDGSYTKLRQLTANFSYDETFTEKADSTDWVHSIDLNVPDGKKLLLEYAYMASGTVNETLTAGNTCTINGVGQGGIDADHRLELEVAKSSAMADAEGVTICKVDSNNYGVFLKDAKFNIYIWNAEQGKYLIINHPVTGETNFATDNKGRIVLDSSYGEDQFAYNTAYYIVEVASPNGYIMDGEPYYFQIAHSNTVAYPSCLPEGFTGRKLTNGDIIYRENVSNITEISVEKYWLDYNGNSVTVTGEEVTEVTLELWQMIEGDPASAKRYDTYQLTPDEDGNWSMTIRNLPRSVKPEGASELSDYLYYFKEVAVNGYALESSENNEGINSGTIKLVNRAQEGYELPETGGTGTTLYTMAGLLLMMSSAAYLMYRPKARRREEI